MSTFVPRTVFKASADTPRSYFLGHHSAGLKSMKNALSAIDLVIECRDYRIPISSRNRLLEDSLTGKQRLIVYTKHDILGSIVPERDNIIRQWHAPTPVVFSNSKEPKNVKATLKTVQELVSREHSITGARMMVVGMPNVGKSTLLNALRRKGVGKGKAAATGAQPGITRAVTNEVKISQSDDGAGIYLVDTPGVFIPYVPDAETMLKLALCGCVKDSVIPPDALCDYLLYRLNLINPELYCRYSAPTNDIDELLKGIARKTGKLGGGGSLGVEAAAIWLIKNWRIGKIGPMVLDTIDKDSLRRKKEAEDVALPSYNQAKLAAKSEAKAKRSAQQRTSLSIPMGL